MSSFSPEPIEIVLGGRSYKVRPLKWKRLLPMKRALGELLKEVDQSTNFAALFSELGKEKPDADAVVNSLGAGFDALMVKVPTVLKLAIPELSEKMFAEDADENDSPDVMQVLNAFDALLKVNGLEFLKNLRGGTANNSPTTPSSPQ